LENKAFSSSYSPSHRRHSLATIATTDHDIAHGADDDDANSTLTLHIAEGAEAFAEENGVSAAALRPPLLALLVFFKAAARKGMSKEHVAQDMQR
jgi:hypothetical protein